VCEHHKFVMHNSMELVYIYTSFCAHSDLLLAICLWSHVTETDFCIYVFALFHQIMMVSREKKRSWWPGWGTLSTLHHGCHLHMWLQLYVGNLKLHLHIKVLISFFSSYDNPIVPDRIVRHEVHMLTSRIDRCLAKSVSIDRSFTIDMMYIGCYLVVN